MDMASAILRPCTLNKAVLLAIVIGMHSLPTCECFLLRTPPGALGRRCAASSLTMGVNRGGNRRAVREISRSGLSRNVPEEKLNRPRFIDEDDGAYGEVGLAMAKWQRTAGPIYIQLAGVAVFFLAFYNYFSLCNANGLSSALWTGSILTMFLGFALQRGDKDRQRPY